MGAVFLGTPAAAIPSLAALADVADVDLVITQPDRPSGRGKRLTESAVATAASQFGFPIVKPETKDELYAALAGGGFDFGLVVAFGRILTPEMIATTSRGFLNVHFSLLPRWRGPAPVERAIAAGDERTGVTLMMIDEGLDTGPVLGEIATPIGPTETGGSLTARLAFLGGTLVDDTTPDLLNGRRTPVPQLDANTTHASMLSKREAQLDPSWSPERAERTIRAFQPRPGAWFALDEGTLKVHVARLGNTATEPGQVVKDAGRVFAGFDGGSVELLTVQPAGKQPLPADAWMNGRRGEPATFAATPL